MSSESKSADGAIVGLALFALLGWGIYSLANHGGDKSKSEPATTSAADPRDEQIKQLTQKVAALENQKSAHHYELRRDGLRTWRFDSDTGETCIQLTTDADWKRRETMRQSCEYEDYMRDKTIGSSDWFWGNCLYLDDKFACNHANGQN